MHSFIHVSSTTISFTILETQIEEDTSIFELSSSLSKVKAGNKWDCPLCKDEGKTLRASFRPMRKGYTSNAQKHLKDVYGERVEFLKNVLDP